ncbi:MAG: nicotinate-nucleotide--dimethylbenzimidazole phosphoribosyltransferase [Peptoniphilus sp.]|nr:nicotinate-nucleotide--dimethylbenzimidazole phosphoribosyltransferase [Peptoniphilus sp.]MDD7363725.1 nicotinate-nucleotide--dimethylbenzimidazole phosphoribosyltransferase [Bacillota bacterium]MDY6044110.1 nicotinate-nucleotide--dimethylbenzimidazole phosphoribosyltransferase [Peptoniphilus sp.]
MMEFDTYLKQIKPIEKEKFDGPKAYWDLRTHPVGSLGELETMSIRLGAIQDRTIPVLEKKSIVVMCADNGVVREDVTSSPQVFTQMLANAMARGETAVSVLSRHVGSNLVVVDIGMTDTIPREDNIVSASVRKGTGDIAVEDAMSREEAVQAIETGIRIAEDEIKKGAQILGTGELGIGNTTTSSAVLAALTKADIRDCVGYGAGITDAQLEKKRAVVSKAIARIGEEADVVDVLKTVGGLDIAGLVGVFLAGAAGGIPVVVDGLISGAAALAAVTLKPEVGDYLFPSHRSAENSAKVFYRASDLRPPLDLFMRLGEGSGCPLFFQLLEAAIACMDGMGSIEDNAIDPSLLVSLRED